MKRFAILAALLVALPTSAATSDWIQFDNSSGRLVFPIAVNGSDAVAVLDTGARTTALSVDSALSAADDGLALGFSGETISVDDVRSVVLSDADVLVGQDALKNHVLQIDYANERLRIIDRKTANLKKSANVKMKRMSGSRYPVVRVNVNGDYKPWVVFDAGSTKSMSFTRERAEKRRWLEKFESDSEGEAPTFIVPALELGPFTHTNTKARVSGYGTDETRILADGRNTGSRLSGTKVKLPEGHLGYEIVNQYVVTIDFKRNLLQMEASSADAGMTADD